jgi:hypothetical protein
MEAAAAVRLHSVRRGVGSLPRSWSIRLTRMSTTPPLDSLMTRVARGDAEAFSDLYDQTSSMVYGLALRVVRSEAMAEEVTQEVFLQVWRQASGFDAQRGSAQLRGPEIVGHGDPRRRARSGACGRRLIDRLTVSGD